MAVAGEKHRYWQVLYCVATMANEYDPDGSGDLRNIQGTIRKQLSYIIISHSHTQSVRRVRKGFDKRVLQ